MFNTKNTFVALTASLLLFSSAFAGDVSNVDEFSGEPMMETGINEPSEAPMVEDLQEQIPFEVIGVNYMDSYNLDINYNSDVLLGTGTELKLYRQDEYLDLSQSIDDTNKVVVTFEGEELNDGDSYSIISLSDLDVNVDFDIEGSTYILNNESNEGDWSRIEVVNSNTLEITLNNQVQELPVLKFLKEVKFENTIYNTGNISAQLKDMLIEGESYILMILGVKDNSGNDIVVSNSLFDFSVEEGSLGGMEDEINIENEELNAASEELTNENVESSEEEVLEITGEELVDIEDVAMEASSTPDTGTKEVFILLMSLLLCGGVFSILRKNIV